MDRRFFYNYRTCAFIDNVDWTIYLCLEDKKRINHIAVLNRYGILNNSPHLIREVVELFEAGWLVLHYEGGYDNQGNSWGEEIDTPL